VEVSQTSGLVQPELSRQSTQVCVEVSQELYGAVTQSASVLHPTHAWFAVSQTSGEVQSASTLHWTQTLLAVSQTFGALQPESSRQSTQVCVETLHVLFGETMQSASLLHPTHTWAIVSHTSGALQSPLSRHSTQTWGSGVRSHVLFGATVQSASLLQSLARHVPMAPVWLEQYSVLGQSLREGLVLHPSTQIPVGPLQIRPESAAPHSLSPSVSVQPQRPLVRQMGLTVESQSERFDALHSVHCPARVPLSWQAGRFGSVVQSASLEQASHTPALHTGVAPEQSVLSRHWTQTLALVSHRGVAPEQSASDTQSTHWPMVPSVEVHTRVTGHPFPPVPRQPMAQISVLPSQTRPDVVEPQSASTAQPHVSLGRQMAPVCEAEQFCSLSVGQPRQHSTQLNDASSQTLPALLPAQGNVVSSVQATHWF
jgi:hypothetical protein